MTSALAVQPSEALAIDIMIEAESWQNMPDAEAIIRHSLDAAASQLSQTGQEIAVVLTDDAAIRALNHQWRGQDKPTNVLSFPAADGAFEGGEFQHLGDIVIAFETVAREAEEEQKPLAHHLAHLAIHGYLHLLGHDHMNDADAETMEQLEIKLLGQLGIPDPYADKTRA